MGEATELDGAEAGAQAAGAMAPDAITAELLAKHAAGEKLDAAGYGKLGAWKAKLKGVFGGKGGPPGGPAHSGSLPGQPAAVAAVATAQAPDAGLADVPADPGLVQRTTAACLTRCESIARRYVTHAARDAGAAPETIARLDRAACLPKDDRALMIELAPDVAASMGVNPRNYPLAVFLGTFGLWSTDIWMAVQEIKQAAADKAKAKATEAGK